MILTVTLNTSIDKAYIVENFKIGDVARVKEAVYTAGGKGLNVTKVVATLGEDVMATGFIGGYAGGFIEHELSKLNIPHEFARIEGETRSCVNIIDEATRAHTELLEPGPLLTPGDVEKFINLYEILLQRAGVITMSGSVPRGVDVNIYKTLIEIARNYGKKVILDTSGEYLKGGIKAGPTLIKPNKKEAEQLLDMTIESTEDAGIAVKKLQDMGIEMPVISLGSKGAVMACGNDFLFAPAPKVNAVNTVSCGDAMIAAFAVAMTRKYSAEEMLKLGVAVSAAKSMTAETGGCRREDVEKMLNKVSIYKI
ncbi:MAG: tagatose 6-phosphate kinase [Thermoanaerobacteraceae bacterium]|jgi:tagatose 6-phosphate kinase|nr:tagatose 6-phosphate kinase [Thermoanaerobacteraceae bacterium]MDN5313505.1 tagatose 6-phosphate kinase [Thermoanaerobacteraceae bacterium]